MYWRSKQPVPECSLYSNTERTSTRVRKQIMSMQMTHAAQVGIVLYRWWNGKVWSIAFHEISYEDLFTNTVPACLRPNDLLAPVCIPNTNQNSPPGLCIRFQNTSEDRDKNPKLVKSDISHNLKYERPMFSEMLPMHGWYLNPAEDFKGAGDVRGGSVHFWPQHSLPKRRMEQWQVEL